MWNYSGVVESLQFIVATSQDSYGRQIKSTATDAQLLAPTHLPEATASSILIVEIIVNELGVCEWTREKKWQNGAFWGGNQQMWIGSSWTTSSVHDWSFNYMVLSFSPAWQSIVYYYESCLA